MLESAFFLVKFTQLTQILHDRRSRRSRQIPSLFKTCHDDKAAVVEWLLVAVSEVPETDGWWLFQIVTGFAELCEYFENCANIGRSIQRPQPNIATP